MVSFTDRHGRDRQPRILVVDDDKLVLLSIGTLLEGREYAFDLAESAAVALNYLSENPYDLMLTDIIMPDMDGIELLREVRRMVQDQLVIMITGHTGLETAIEAIRLGAYDYVLKPVDDQHMMQCIDRGLEKARLRLFEKEHQRILEAKVIEQSERIRLIFSEAIEALVNAIEARDSYTQGHSLRVTHNVDLLVDKLQLPAEMAREFNLAAKLHDIGKLGMADAILNKTSELTDNEYELIKAHPDVGYNILKPMLDESALSAIRHHHESWDGTGYPSGLAGSDVPLGARIIALADTYDAMTSNRAYRPAVEREKAFSELERSAGKSLDPELIPPFIAVLKENE